MRTPTVFAALSLLTGFAASSAAARDAGPLVYTGWTKSCPLTEEDKYDCVTANYARHRDGTAVVTVQLIETENRSKTVLRVTFPLGVQLVPGTRLIIDRHKPTVAPYMSCLAVGCTANHVLNPEVIARLKRGKQLTLEAIQADGKRTSTTFSLGDFESVFDGPGNDVDGPGKHVKIFSKPPKRPPPESWKDDRLQRHLQPPQR